MEDTVSFRINSASIGGSYVLTSSSQVSMVRNFRFQQRADGIMLSYNGKDTTLPAVQLDKRLQVEIVVNGQSTKLLVDLNKGPILLFGYATKADGILSRRIVTVEQHSQPLYVF